MSGACTAKAAIVIADGGEGRLAGFAKKRHLDLAGGGEGCVAGGAEGRVDPADDGLTDPVDPRHLGRAAEIRIHSGSAKGSP